jgi:DNA-binding PadR family transcriptional regulator
MEVLSVPTGGNNGFSLPTQETSFMQNVIATPPPARPGRRAPRGMRAPLGTFQYIAMRTIARLGDDAYGMAIEDYISNEIGLTIDLAQVYITTKRLLECGYLTAREMPAPGGSGHTVKVYRVSEEGARVLKEAAAFFAAVAKLDQEANPHGSTTPPRAGQKKARTKRRTRSR